MAPRVWFITGASSGFGRAMTEAVLRHGDIAVATLRTPEVIADIASQYSSDRLLAVKLDVSKEEDVISAFTQTREAFGRVDVVFNNAGFGVFAEIEATPLDAARAMFEVNFWGAANVSREAVRHFREVNTPQGGILLQVNSMAGYQGVALNGYYCASKFALQGLTEALVTEVDPEWNIKIVSIDSGAFRTNGPNAAIRIPPHPAYNKPNLLSSKYRSWIDDPNLALRGDVNKAVDVIYKVADLDDPPVHFPLGRDSVDVAKKKVESLLADVDKYATWSDGTEAD
ncbi:NAD(P)-binding protein [Wolfiporia cocos MD-104 SS10]|uniref:NAD(P)-binding protein n=1 Tax=Wolfiporia cocos (strain MD-104) TaxID=742152 RepID=A0A2H3JAJ7_WOLCO|nr:NAD(P)-binding protein [Wolfiporia cocos MD-104 SS10]